MNDRKPTPTRRSLDRGFVPDVFPIMLFSSPISVLDRQLHQ